MWMSQRRRQCEVGPIENVPVGYVGTIIQVAQWTRRARAPDCVVTAQTVLLYRLVDTKLLFLRVQTCIWQVSS
jgi:hypothetical protein